MFRQRLLHIWTNILAHHVFHVTTQTVMGAIMVGGAAATVVTVVPTHHKAAVIKPVPVAVVQKKTTKPAAKKPAPAPKPVPKPVPKKTTAAPAPAPKPAAPAPKPVAIAPTQPSPGKSVQKLVPTPSPSTSTSTTSSSGSSGSSSSGTTTTSTAPAAASGGYYSTNWSGYAALSGKFTTVSGSWTVPKVTGNGTDTTGDAAWVGIGGVSSTDLIQAGTMDMVSPDGTVTISVFYELLPAPAMEVTSFDVQVGDVMTASISQLPSGDWNIIVTDETTAQTFSTAVSYTSSYSSAEWIEEDPSYADGSLVTFDSFDHIIFTSGSTTMDGATANLSASNADPITLVDSKNNPVATPSVLISSDGFWVVHN